jgi:5'-methylthioadenosine phosphorylase
MMGEGRGGGERQCSPPPFPETPPHPNPFPIKGRGLARLDIPARLGSNTGMSEWVIGIIGGSGLDAIDALEEAQWIAVDTPWGAPSDALLTGRIESVRFLFLPRHGRGHRIPPGDLNYRANIDALKRAGCTDLVAISAIGSLREDLPPGRFVVADQFIDRTVARKSSFFGPGLVAHVSMADPVCPRLSALVADAAVAAGAPVTRGGTYVAIEGPQFSTRAESLLYRAWGGDVIGMTAMPEAKLAREAELPYALIGMVTDYDCWKEDEPPADVAIMVGRLQANAGLARRLVVELARSLPRQRTPSPIDTNLGDALLTAPAARDPAMVARLDAICRRVLG